MNIINAYIKIFGEIRIIYFVINANETILTDSFKNLFYNKYNVFSINIKYNLLL